jgi:Tol biopolymer transport system component
MQFKRELVFIVSCCILLSASVSLLINVRAQAPGKAQIAFDSARDGIGGIYVMGTDGKNQRNLTNHGDIFPAWSPDGKKIAFQSVRDGNGEIYVMDADGKNQRNLTNNHAYDGYPTWSPDGKKIAFCSDSDGNYEIYVMDVDGKNQRRLTNNPANDGSPNWFDPAYVYAVSPSGKFRGTWGWLKQTSR